MGQKRLTQTNHFEKAPMKFLIKSEVEDEAFSYFQSISTAIPESRKDSYIERDLQITPKESRVYDAPSKKS